MLCRTWPHVHIAVPRPLVFVVVHLVVLDRGFRPALMCLLNLATLAAMAVTPPVATIWTLTPCAISPMLRCFKRSFPLDRDVLLFEHLHEHRGKGGVAADK